MIPFSDPSSADFSGSESSSQADSDSSAVQKIVERMNDLLKMTDDTEARLEHNSAEMKKLFGSIRQRHQRWWE